MCLWILADVWKRFMLRLMANLSRQEGLDPSPPGSVTPKGAKAFGVNKQTVWWWQSNSSHPTADLATEALTRCRNQSKGSAETKWQQAASCNIQLHFPIFWSVEFFCCSGAKVKKYSALVGLLLCFNHKITLVCMTKHYSQYRYYLICVWSIVRFQLLCLLICIIRYLSQVLIICAIILACKSGCCFFFLVRLTFKAYIIKM